MTKSSKIIHLFWTGGWDSTFHLIQLLRETDDEIQPHYIVRHEDTTGIEIYVMTLIRREIIRVFPDVSSRFLPTHYVNEDLITNFEEINQQVEELRKTTRVNDQYRIMANYCRENSIINIDVSLDKTPGQPAEEWLDEHFKGATAFDCFRYPIFHLTKYDMYKIAKKNEWDEILSLTSFCRRPHIKIEPCGTCGPCVDAVISGMGFRLPFLSRMKAKIQIPFRRYWRNNYNKKKNTKLFKFVTKKFESKF